MTTKTKITTALNGDPIIPIDRFDCVWSINGREYPDHWVLKASAEMYRRLGIGKSFYVQGERHTVRFSHHDTYKSPGPAAMRVYMYYTTDDIMDDAGNKLRVVVQFGEL